MNLRYKYTDSMMNSIFNLFKIDFKIQQIVCIISQIVRHEKNTEGRSSLGQYNNLGQMFLVLLVIAPQLFIVLSNDFSKFEPFQYFKVFKIFDPGYCTRFNIKTNQNHSLQNSTNKMVYVPTPSMYVYTSQFFYYQILYCHCM